MDKNENGLIEFKEFLDLSVNTAIGNKDMG